MNSQEVLQKVVDEFWTQYAEQHWEAQQYRVMLVPRESPLEQIRQARRLWLGSVIYDRELCSLFDATLQRRVLLTPSEGRLLSFLLNNQGRLLTVPQLVQHLARSGEDAILASGVKVYVCRLRDKVAQLSPAVAAAIETRRGLGYLLRSGLELRVSETDVSSAVRLAATESSSVAA